MIGDLSHTPAGRTAESLGPLFPVIWPGQARPPVAPLPGAGDLPSCVTGSCTATVSSSLAPVLGHTPSGPAPQLPQTGPQTLASGAQHRGGQCPLDSLRSWPAGPGWQPSWRGQPLGVSVASFAALGGSGSAEASRTFAPAGQQHHRCPSAPPGPRLTPAGSVLPASSQVTMAQGRGPGGTPGSLPPRRASAWRSASQSRVLQREPLGVSGWVSWRDEGRWEGASGAARHAWASTPGPPADSRWSCPVVSIVTHRLGAEGLPVRASSHRLATRDSPGDPGGAPGRLGSAGGQEGRAQEEQVGTGEAQAGG